jgi:hypothetical protein
VINLFYSLTLLIRIKDNKKNDSGFFMGRSYMRFYKTICGFMACVSFVSLFGMEEPVGVVMASEVIATPAIIPQKYPAFLNVEQWLRDLGSAVATRSSKKALFLFGELNFVVNPPNISLIHDQRKSSLLMIAAQHSQTAFAKAILARIPKNERTSYVNMRDACRFSAFDYAVHSHCMRLINLLAHYADQCSRDTVTMILKQHPDYELHKSGDGLIMGLGALSFIDPSDDEDDQFVLSPMQPMPHVLCMQSEDEGYADEADCSVVKFSSE